MELTGKILAVLEAKSGTSSRTGNPWMMQEYVIEVPGQFPRRCMFSVFGEDKIKQLNIQNGEELTVQFDIDAREYNGRWYNDIRAYNVIRGTVAQPIPAANVTGPAAYANNDPLPFGDTGDDGGELPF